MITVINRVRRFWPHWVIARPQPPVMAESSFFAIFLLTVVLTRLFLYINPLPAPTFNGIRTHHYMYGIVGVILGLTVASLPTFAIGMGLFTDELTFVLMGGKTHHDNYWTVSLIGTAVFAGLVFLARRFLVKPFEG